MASVDGAGNIRSTGTGETEIQATADGAVGSATLVVSQTLEAQDVFGTVVFVGVNVVPVTFDGVLTDHTVVVEGETIAEVGPRSSASIPAGAHVVDGTGQGWYLMPGLTDMHTHFATETSLAAGPGQLLLYLANGVTTILNQGDFGGPFAQWKDDANNRRIDAPTIYLAKYVRGPQDGAPISVQVVGAENARAYVCPRARAPPRKEVFAWWLIRAPEGCSRRTSGEVVIRKLSTPSSSRRGSSSCTRPPGTAGTPGSTSRGFSALRAPRPEAGLPSPASSAPTPGTSTTRVCPWWAAVTRPLRHGRGGRSGGSPSGRRQSPG